MSELNRQTDKTLPKAEADVLRKRMEAAWGVEQHYWWPLSDPRPAHAEAFQDYFFEREFGYASLRRILAEHGVTSVFEFREDGEAYQVRVESFEPSYALEGFWTSDRFDWILYASHESSITVGGEWLLPAVQAAWPSWKQRVWTSPFYERPE